MLKNLKRWLGLEPDSAAEPTSGTAPSTASIAVKSAARPAASAKTPGKKKHAMEVLDNPRLSLERPEDGFDPYNTGAFNRSQSWERIGKKR